MVKEPGEENKVSCIKEIHQRSQVHFSFYASLLLSFKERRRFSPFPSPPRSSEQLDKLLDEINMPIDKVIYFDVPFEVIKERLKSRGRSDDTEETILKRRKVFEEETFPLVDYFILQGKLKTINGYGDINEISQEIFKVLDPSL